MEGKYFDLRICPAREVGLYTSFQICFANNILLKATRSLNPKPSFALVSPNKSHFLQ